MKEKIIIFKIKTMNQLIVKELIKGHGNLNSIPNPTQIKIMEYLIDNKDKEILQKDLEKKLEVSRATISDVLATMEKHDFIKRVQSKTDTRTNKIIIQPKTIIIYEKAIENIKRINNKMINDISEKDLQIFNHLLEKMMSNLKD